jgi:hypothetical protein
MIRLALIVLLVIVPGWQVYSAIQGINLSQCSTDTECMVMHGGTGGLEE